MELPQGLMQMTIPPTPWVLERVQCWQGPERAVHIHVCSGVIGRRSWSPWSLLGYLVPASASQGFTNPFSPPHCARSYHCITWDWVIKGKRHHLGDLLWGGISQANPLRQDSVGHRESGGLDRAHHSLGQTSPVSPWASLSSSASQASCLHSGCRDERKPA